MTTQQPEPRRRRSALVVIGALAFLAVAAGGAYGISYLFLRDTPAAVGASASPAALGSATVAPETSGDDGSAAADVSGTWTVDGSIGSFDDFTSSFVGYRVQEELASIGAATAVGRTPDVTGSLTLEGTTLASAEITADLTTLQSDDDRRDNQLRRQALETSAFPTATFVLSQAIELPASALAGETVELQATGELTLHGVTKAVEVPITASLANGVITVTGSIDIAFADFDIERPQSMIVLSVDDHGVMEFQLHFTAWA